MGCKGKGERIIMRGGYCVGRERDAKKGTDGNIEEYEGKEGMKDEGMQREGRVG
jgi:hypothetical protein